MTQFSKFFLFLLGSFFIVNYLMAMDEKKELSVARGTSSQHDLPDLEVTVTLSEDESGNKISTLSFPGFYITHGGNIMPYLKAIDRFLKNCRDETIRLHINLSQSNLDDVSLELLSKYTFGFYQFDEERKEETQHEKLAKLLYFLDISLNRITLDGFYESASGRFERKLLINVLQKKCPHLFLKMDSADVSKADRERIDFVERN